MRRNDFTQGKMRMRIKEFHARKMRNVCNWIESRIDVPETSTSERPTYNSAQNSV